MSATRHIVVFYTDAGGGHRATAQALQSILEKSGRYRLTLLNPYRELIPHLDLMKRVTGRPGESFYNDVVLRKGQTGLVCWLFYAVLKLNYILFGAKTVHLLDKAFERLQPDMVVSVMPLANDVILKALNRYKNRCKQTDQPPKMAVLITDWSEIGRAVWFPRRGDYHAICGTQKSLDQAARVPALSGPHIHPMTGLLIRPGFAQAAKQSASSRQALGLDPDRPVVTIMYGAEGSDRMKAIAKALHKTPLAAQIVFLCGRNIALATALRSEQFAYSHQIVEYTDLVPSYLTCSSIFIGKPGPGSVSEALAMGLPVLLDRSMTLPQEAAVLEHVTSNGLGHVFTSMDEFHDRFEQLMATQPANGESKQSTSNLSAQQIESILDQIHSGAPAFAEMA
jgi:Glycosyltransferase family 28 C-terminal domain